MVRTSSSVRGGRSGFKRSGGNTRKPAWPSQASERAREAVTKAKSRKK